MLLQGSAEADDPDAYTLWDAYREWGYVSMYGEASCGAAAASSLGLSLEAPPPADHVLLEPFQS